jgi:cytochrome c551/c552
MLLFLLAATVARAIPPTEEGKTIFTARCAGCHNVNKILTGPALAGVSDRRSIDWIIQFVHSSQTVIRSGDTYANALYNKFNRIQMPDHPDLTAENIKSVVAYIQIESKAAAEKPPLTRLTHLQPNYTPVSITNYMFFGTYLFLVALLVLALLMLVQVKSLQRNQSGHTE